MELFLRLYQRVVYLPGTFLLLFVVAGAVGVALGIRRRTRGLAPAWAASACCPG